MHTVHAYANVCSKLDGFPGLLRKVNLLQAGPCPIRLLGPYPCGNGLACTTSDKKPGKCMNTAKPSATPICACVANPISNI